jgi:hypothetical protein
MNDISNIIDKMKVILQDGRKIRIDDADVAVAIGMQPKNFSSYKSRGKVPLEEISAFCASKKVSINWVLFDQLASSLEDSTMRYVGVKYIKEVNGACGSGTAFIDFEEYEIVKFPWYMIEHLKKTTKIENILIINVVGDSMEPMLQDKDRIFVDRSKVEPNSKDMFVVRTPDGILVKKIKIEDNKITLISLNELHYNMEVDYEIEILGTVVGKF